MPLDIFRQVVLAATLGMGSLTLAACDDADSPAEQAGEAAEDAGDAAEDAADDAADAVEDATN